MQPTWLKWELNTPVLATTPNRPVHVADGSTTAMWWARACAILHKSWRHVRLKLPSPRKRLHLKFPSGEVRRDSLNKFRPFLGGIGIVILNVKNAKSHNVPLSFLERSIDCTSALMFVLFIHSKAVKECYWIANSVIKMLMNGVCT